MLDVIPKASSSEIVEKYKDILNIQIHLYDPIARDKLDNQCKEFQHFAKQIRIKAAIPSKPQVLQKYFNFNSERTLNETKSQVTVQLSHQEPFLERFVKQVTYTTNETADPFTQTAVGGIPENVFKVEDEFDDL